MFRCCTSRVGKIYHLKKHSLWSFVLRCTPCFPSKVVNCHSSMWSIFGTLNFGDLGDPVIFCNLECVEHHPSHISKKKFILSLTFQSHKLSFVFHLLGPHLLHSPPPWNLAWEARRHRLLESDAWSWGLPGLGTYKLVISVNPALKITTCAGFSDNFQLINSEKHWKSYNIGHCSQGDFQAR